MDEQAKVRLLESLASQELDPGLVVVDAAVIEFEYGWCLLVRYTDHRYPGQQLAGWWDLRRYDGDPDDPGEAEAMASFAKVWLEELFHTGPRLSTRPVDDYGVAWAEMEALDPLLPPHLRRGTAYVVVDLRGQPPLTAHVEHDRAYVSYAGPGDWRSALEWARTRADAVVVRIGEHTYWAGASPAPDGVPLLPEEPVVPLDAVLDGLRRAEQWRTLRTGGDEGDESVPSGELAEIDRQALMPTGHWFRRRRRRRRVGWVVLGDPEAPQGR